MEEKRKERMEAQENTTAMGVGEDSAEGEEESIVIKFGRPYLFDRREYTEIDLSGMENLTGDDMVAINRHMARSLSGSAAVPEVSVEYACYFASRATQLPVEFFTGLPAREVLKVKNRVVGFLFGQD